MLYKQIKIDHGICHKRTQGKVSQRSDLSRGGKWHFRQEKSRSTHTRDRVVEKTCVRKHVVKIEPHEEIGWTHKVQIMKDFKRYARGVRLYHAEGRAVETITNGKLENV